MHFTFRQLQVFLAVAEQGSFTRAAEALCLSQPAVSMQVKQLERHTGLALFEQFGKRIELTHAGHELAIYARRIAGLLEEADTVFEQIRDARRGRLSVSVASTAGAFATRLLAAFARRHPAARISLDVTNNEGLYAQLDANACDLVIMGRPPEALDLVADPFMDNPLVMIAPPEHPLAGHEAVALQRFAAERFVVREPGSGTRRAAEGYFARHGVPFDAHLEMTTNEAIKQAVAAGLGLAVVSQHTLGLELASGALVRLDVAGLPIVRQWYVAHRRGRRLSPLAVKFRDLVLSEAGDYV